MPHALPLAAHASDSSPQGPCTYNSFRVPFYVVITNHFKDIDPVYSISARWSKNVTHLKTASGLGFTLCPFLVPAPPAAVEELRKMRIACGWDVELIDEWIIEIKEGRRIQWTAFKDDTAIGMCALNIYSIHDESLANGVDRGEVAGMFLYPEWRSLGIGKTMMTYVEHEAAQMGMKITTVNTRSMGPSLGPYLRRGYREYKGREMKYLLETILGLGLTPEHMSAAFLEKPVPAASTVFFKMDVQTTV
ncbi:hypothetical protein DACRYDRAFT_17955 [Dacryopinax primogenitus]|uniref:N-acetyltransferase domain-containing protein n=1 Tax=Dacryopinax primogenitus (strain DJM 731) TaxID=1858805 RepID=M5FZ02_DACPD|nr:uncharacterized protein DACRYDRAFT_17955 [Dacryopinax primogenitus]EJT98806.1 hypothetical protein DACRYDRAFT_17955 [Dacryopinax primogenitus]